MISVSPGRLGVKGSGMMRGALSIPDRLAVPCLERDWVLGVVTITLWEHKICMSTKLGQQPL